jgi:hypothetical protein
MLSFEPFNFFNVRQKNFKTLKLNLSFPEKDESNQDLIKRLDILLVYCQVIA